MKSHFTFTKQQRNGILLLVCIIIILQTLYFFVDFSSDNIQLNSEQLSKFQKEIDSLKQVELNESKPKIFPFNPNYITDYRGSVLGMSNEEIDRLLSYRKQNKWINSTKQFQEVTKVSDSLLNAMSPYFKFPEWVNENQTSKTIYSFNNKPKAYAQKQDLNTATALDLQTVNGVGAYYSKQIIAYRNKFKGGFISDIQLLDINGLTPEVIESITELFTVKSPRKINTIDLNKANVNDLVTIQHIDYNLANEIIEQRVLREGYKALDELIKVKGFPVNKIEIIKLYLHLEKEKINE